MNRVDNIPIFPNLTAEMARKGYDTKALADLLGRDYRTAQSRLSGGLPFNLDEMKLIKSDWFPTKSLEYIFAKKDEIEEE
jgi:hypothetical protein